MIKISSEASKKFKKTKKKNTSVLRRYFSLLYPKDYVNVLVPEDSKQ